ncbi:AAA family ATPase [Streptomyces sp. MB09-01]|uniref:AAA family ATPase n=1 Tax=Streptomyces sp. MB09-01 TaxID=3028666 RepID=UPI0029B36D6E|nr:AAA family ATPase [Streptomyces sp. MB09-01]MDX3536501.1 AAA family ATPase [Streptomyces sp. MB09-01]
MSPKDTEWGLVTEWVRDYLFITGEPRSRLVQFGFTPEFVSRIPLNYVSSDNAVALVEAVRNDGVDTQLHLLETLGRIDSLSSLPAGKEALRLKCELEHAARLHVSPQDHFLSTVLGNGTEVFIDRADLRSRLREFVEDPDKTVLVVDGEPDSGRSYTYHLIRHVGLHSRFRPVRLTLNRASTAEQVIFRLSEFVADPRTALAPLNPTQLNDPLPEMETALHRIVSQATAASGQYWFVLDDCDKLDVNSDVWDCIGKLALTIYEHRPVQPDAAPRLVLLGYSPTMRQLPYEIRKNEVRDIARMLGPEDLRHFYLQFFTEATAEAAAAEAAATEADPAGATADPAAADPAAPPDEQRMSALVEAAVPAVLEAGDAPGPDSYMRKLCTAAEESVRLYRSLAPGQDFGALLRERLCAAAASPGPAPVSDLRRAYREAASLLTRFDKEQLRLPGEEEPSKQAALELVQDCRAAGARDSCTWVLKSEVRDTALRGFAGPQQARQALMANLDQIPPGPGPEQTALAYLRGDPPDLARQHADELPHTLQAVLWLAQIPGMTGLPETAAVQGMLERARLLQPLERLVQSPFQGRADELAQLRAYIGMPASTLPGRLRQIHSEVSRAGATERPVLIHGLGGVGKSTLLAQFLLESLHDSPTGFPFAYIDFERPTLSVHEPATLIAEMARQLGIQYPQQRAAFDALAHECEAAAGVHRTAEDTVDELYGLSTTRATMGRLSASGLHALAAAREGVLAAQLATLVVAAVGVPAAEQPPLVLVIDSFEEAQYSGSPELGRMWGVWSGLQKVHPRLRTVVAGRLLERHPARVVQPLAIELRDLDHEAAVALLVSCGVTDERLAVKLAERVGGHPLSLKLAARAAVQAAESDRDGGNGDGAQYLNALIESLPRRRRHFFRAVDQMLIQGTLYERLLGRIRDPEVRALAQAGLGLRSITPRLIREVLAAPCGLVVESDEEAERLFELLSRLDLVESAGQGTVCHRSDLRAIMLRLADRARTDQMRAVGRLAVAYYAAQDGPEARAEEIYHRLRLNESPRKVELRWMPGVERLLAGAEQDMAGRSAAYLSGRLGGHASDEVMAEADQEDWERITAHEVEDLLSQGYAEAAAARLDGRRPWTAGSPLHPLWAETLDRLGRRPEARAAAEAAVQDAEEAGFPELRLELLLLSARLAEADGDVGEADDDLAEAEEAARGLGRGFEALGALLSRARLAAGTEAHNHEIDGRLADRLRRLSNAELARRPALVRAAAAAVSRDHPEVLERTLDVVGLPETEEAVLESLAQAVDRVVAGRPELRGPLLGLLEDAGPSDGALSSGSTHTGVLGILRAARARGTLDRLAGRLLHLDDRSGELASGVAAAMASGAPADAGQATRTAERHLARDPADGDRAAARPAGGSPTPVEGNGHRAA